MDEIPISTNQYPPGIRFHPSDEELISFYLQRKMKSLPLPPNVIIDIHLYSYDPWDLPRNTLFGEDEWYFFTPRDRKYPNGGRPNRAAASGYWKATGSDQPIRSSFGSRKIGVKKALVFYKGKPPSGHRMNWIMTEYRLPDTSRPSRSAGSMRLDDWVLCRIRQKGNMSKNEIWDDQTSSQIRKQKNLECGRDGRDMLADYLKSNEYNLIVSLLAGRDPAAAAVSPTTVIPCNENGDGSRGIQSEKMDSDEPKFYSETSDQSKEQISCGNVQLHSSSMINQSGPLVAASDARSHGQHESRGTKCKKPCISMQELDMLSALQEMFLQ